jgi:hypothetical protein
MARDDLAIENVPQPPASQQGAAVSPLPKPKELTADGAAAPQCESVESAAAKLRVSAVALRARCRREAKRTREAIVLLGGGITAFKFGRTWRFIFPTRP